MKIEDRVYGDEEVEAVVECLKKGWLGMGASVAEMLQREKELGIHDFKTYEDFARRVYKNREKLVRLVRELKSQGRSIAGYGAPAKATTLLSFCNLGSDVIDYIVDDSPLKQGLYLPGMHIPIVSSEIPARATMSPDATSSTSFLFKPSLVKSFVTL